MCVIPDDALLEIKSQIEELIKAFNSGHTRVYRLEVTSCEHCLRSGLSHDESMACGRKIIKMIELRMMILELYLTPCVLSVLIGLICRCKCSGNSLNKFLIRFRTKLEGMGYPRRCSHNLKYELIRSILRRVHAYEYDEKGKRFYSDIETKNVRQFILRDPAMNTQNFDDWYRKFYFTLETRRAVLSGPFGITEF